MKSDCRSATGETALEEKGEEGKRGHHCQQQHQRPMNTEEAPRDRRNRGDSVGSINLGNGGRGIPHLLAMMMRSRTVRTTMMDGIMKKACSGCHQPRRRKQQHGNGTGYGAELLHVWEANVGRSQSAAKKKMQIICNSEKGRGTLSPATRKLPHHKKPHDRFPVLAADLYGVCSREKVIGGQRAFA